MDERPGATLTIPAPARMLTLNAERKMNAFQRANIVSSWREAAWALAKQARLAPMGPVHITAFVHQRGSVLADAGSHFPSVKAIIDGLVDAKILPDDGPEFVLSLRQYAAKRSDANIIVIHLEEV